MVCYERGCGIEVGCRDHGGAGNLSAGKIRCADRGYDCCDGGWLPESGIVTEGTDLCINFVVLLLVIRIYN